MGCLLPSTICPGRSPLKKPMRHKTEAGQVASKLKGGQWKGFLELSQQKDRLVGLVVKASASRVKDPGFKSSLSRDFFEVES